MFPQINAPSSIHQRPGLSEDALRRLAPSVFAASPLPGVSDRYSFVPTAQIVSGLRGAGWVPVSAFEQRVRLDERRGFQKHLLRFQRADVVPARGEYTPELVLVNSHDRSSAYQLHAGLFRFVCGNGMIVADTTFERVTIRHSGFTPEEVTEASFRILDQVPTITGNVEKFRSRILTTEEATAFARTALTIRFEDEAAGLITPIKLLESRRREDRGDDLGEPNHLRQCRQWRERVHQPDGGSGRTGRADGVGGGLRQRPHLGLGARLPGLNAPYRRGGGEHEDRVRSRRHRCSLPRCLRHRRRVADYHYPRGRGVGGNDIDRSRFRGVHRRHEWSLSAIHGGGVLPCWHASSSVEFRIDNRSPIRYSAIQGSASVFLWRRVADTGERDRSVSARRGCPLLKPPRLGEAGYGSVALRRLRPLVRHSALAASRRCRIRGSGGRAAQTRR